MLFVSIQYKGTCIFRRVKGRFARNPAASLQLLWLRGVRWDLYVRAKGAAEQRVRDEFRARLCLSSCERHC